MLRNVLQEDMLVSEKPLVSVIIPAYNTESFIDKCLKSVQVQTYVNLEVLVIDDGSTDGTGAVCRRFAEADSRFRVLRKENSGVSDSRNLGLEQAKGKYLVFVDSDDHVKPDYVQTLVSEAEREDVQLVCGEFFFEEDGREVKHDSILGEEERMLLTRAEAIELLPNKGSFQGYICSKLFLSEVIRREKLRFDRNVKVWEDMLFCLQYLTKIQKVSYVGRPIYDYVQRSGSAMADARVLNEFTQLTALEKMWQIAQPMQGAFHDYVRDSYALNLVAALGKPGFQEETSVKAVLEKTEALHGRLPVKHAMKRFIFRYAKFASRILWGRI